MWLELCATIANGSTGMDILVTFPIEKFR